MTRLLFVICFFLTGTALMAGDIERAMDSLNAAVWEKDTYIALKEKRIKAIKDNLAVAGLAADKYLCCKQLYTQYRKYNPDSAAKYIEISNSIAVANRNEAWRQEARLNTYLIHALQSVHLIVENEIASLPPIEDFDPANRPLYALLMLDNQIHKGPMQNDEGENKAVWEKYAPYLAGSPYSDYYCSALTRQRIAPQRLSEAIKKTKDDWLLKAVLEYTLFEQFRRRGRNDEAFHHLVNAAICDIKGANRESQALLSIVMMITSGEVKIRHFDVNRLVGYVNICGENARIYKDFGRSTRVVEAQQKIFDSYGVKTYGDLITLRIISWVAGVLLILLLAFYLLNRRRTHRLRDEVGGLRAELEQIKRENERNYRKLAELAESRERDTTELNKRDKTIVKLLFTISNSVMETKGFKKRLSNLLKTNMTREAQALIESPVLIDEEMDTLYKNFDAAFLTVHPDFPERFNALLREDGRISLKAPGVLSPELRIYALVCLGLSDSRKIANILHYSTQTVYNYRMKVRHSATVPEKEFAQYVGKLYATNIVSDNEVEA